MKTRTLLLLAVACGIAILGAGVALMWRLANTDDVAPPHRMGESVRIGDAVVVIDDLQRSGPGAVAVAMTVSGVDDPDGGDDFRLLVGATLQRPVEGSTCTVFTVDPSTCQVVFDVPAEATSLNLVLRRADEQVNWQLSVAP